MMLCEKVKKIQQAGFQTLAPTFLRAQGNACRRVTRGGKGGAIARAASHYGGAK